MQHGDGDAKYDGNRNNSTTISGILITFLRVIEIRCYCRENGAKV